MAAGVIASAVVCPLTMVTVHGPLVTTSRGAKASGSDHLVSGPWIALWS